MSLFSFCLGKYIWKIPHSNELYPQSSNCRLGTSTFLLQFTKISCFLCPSLFSFFLPSCIHSFIPPCLSLSLSFSPFLPCKWYVITVLLLESMENFVGVIMYKDNFPHFYLKKLDILNILPNKEYIRSLIVLFSSVKKQPLKTLT